MLKITLERWQIITEVNGVETSRQVFPNQGTSYITETLVKLRYSPQKPLDTEYFMVSETVNK